MRLEEGLIEWIRVLREDLEDFRVRVVAKEINSCGEELRDERSFFSIVIFAESFECDFQCYLYIFKIYRLWIVL